MTQTPVAAASVVRVTAVSGARRVDLAVPATVPVAELLPELVRTLGVLDAQTVYGGYHLRSSDGRRLSPEAGLLSQGVEDGGVLTVEAGVDDTPPRVYDDVVEAMADAVEGDTRPWEPAASRRTALASAAILLALGALALGLQRPSLVAGAAAGVGALVLVAAAVVVARVQKEPEVACLLGWAGVVYATVAGLAAAPRGDLLGLPSTLAGGAALIVALVALFGLVELRALLLPAVLVAALLTAGSGVVAGTGLAPAPVFLVVLVVALLAGFAVPRLALGATRTRVPQAHSTEELTAEPAPVVAEEVRADVRRGHELLLAFEATSGLLLVLVAPLLVHLGWAGALLGACAAAVLLLRTRQLRVGREVGIGMASGLLGLVALAVSVIVERPDWRAPLAAVLALAGAVLLVSALVPGSPSVRRGRAADVVEIVALVALLPLAVVAVGVLGTVGT